MKHLIQDVQSSDSKFKDHSQAIKSAHTPIGVLADWWQDRIKIEPRSRRPSSPNKNTYTRVAPLGSHNTKESLSIFRSIFNDIVIGLAFLKETTPKVIRSTKLKASALFSTAIWIPQKYNVKQGMKFDWRRPAFILSAKYGFPIIAALTLGMFVAIANPDIPQQPGQISKGGGTAKNPMVIMSKPTASVTKSSSRKDCAGKANTKAPSRTATTKSTSNNSPSAPLAPYQPAATITPPFVGGMGGDVTKVIPPVNSEPVEPIIPVIPTVPIDPINDAIGDTPVAPVIDTVEGALDL